MIRTEADVPEKKVAVDSAAGERLKKIAELRAQIAMNERDPNHYNEQLGRYSRELLYNIGDFEKAVKAAPRRRIVLTAVDENMKRTDESEDERKKELVGKVLRLLYLITPMTDTEGPLVNALLALNVHQSPYLENVIFVMVDRIISKKPELSEVYAKICAKQVSAEEKANNGVSRFENVLLKSCQLMFRSRAMTNHVKEKESEIDAQTDDKKKKEMRESLDTELISIREAKFGIIRFIGHLYLQELMSIRIVAFCINDLLLSIANMQENLVGCTVDEDDVECAIVMLNIIGKRLHREYPRASPHTQFSTTLFTALKTLKDAADSVNSRIRTMILSLLELDMNNWEHKKRAPAPSRDLIEYDELRKTLKEHGNAIHICVDIRVFISFQRFTRAERIHPLKAADENSQLRKAVTEMQITMKTMRSAMACLEKQNEALLELVRTRNE